MSPYSNYHWQKYSEHVALGDDNWPRLWEPLARYVARISTTDTKRPATVAVISRRALNLSVHDGAGREDERIEVVYTLDLTGGEE